ncbi:MAG: glycosyltransferase family 4 protein [Flaviflexus sp.]|nr:glycosyltransferase family 4 protein [Flaviflexus sp.]
MTEIAILTLDTFSEKMAGPAIRVWEMARLLAKEHEVTVFTFARADATPTDFRLRAADHVTFHSEIGEPEIIILQGSLLRAFPWLAEREAKLVIDLYDPFHLESLGGSREEPLADRQAVLGQLVAELDAQIDAGDFFLCASEPQRSLWLGHLAARGRVNPRTYDDDPSLTRLIDIAPFGIDFPFPAPTATPLRDHPGIGPDDPVLIWGGGIYNWFDPLTVIRAVGLAKEQVPNLRLFFLGAGHPHPDMPQMEMARKARELTAEAGLEDHVFFGEDWVDYAERHNYLADAAAGVTAHFADIETRFSFRTRILDCLWAGLPIITTEGDFFADLVTDKGLGVAVPVEDPVALASAITQVLDHREAMSERVREVAAAFAWESTLAPLLAYCRDPYVAADRGDRAKRVAARLSRPSLRTLAVRTKNSLQSRGIRGTAAKIRTYLRR